MRWRTNHGAGGKAERDTRIWVLACLMSTLLCACSQPPDSSGWALDAGSTCGPRQANASADVGVLAQPKPGEQSCGLPSDEIRVSSGDYEELTELEGACDIYRGDIHVSPLTDSRVDLSFFPPLRVIEGGFQISSGVHLGSLDGLDRLEYVGMLALFNGMPVLADLTGLSNLRMVRNTLLIRGASALTDLRGLENLRWAGEIELDNNDALQSLDGLAGLETVHGLFAVSSNDSLEDLSGLSNLEYVGALSINRNQSLTDLHGLENLKSVGYLGFGSNPSLRSLQELEQLRCVSGDVHFRNNAALAQEEIDGLLERIEVGGEVRID